MALNLFFEVSEKSFENDGGFLYKFHQAELAPNFRYNEKLGSCSLPYSTLDQIFRDDGNYSSSATTPLCGATPKKKDYFRFFLTLVFAQLVGL